MWLSDTHKEFSQADECTRKEADLPLIPVLKPVTDIIVDPETGATPGEIDDK